jgi:hypothetical protein
MEATLTHPAPSAANAAPSKTSRRAGAALSALAVLFLLFDGAMKLATLAPVAESFERVGIPFHLARGVGLLEIACVALYLSPRTAALGAVLLTGFLGGAILTHLRIGDPLFSHTLFPAYVGAMVWGGLFLRDERVRALAPWRAREST